MLQLRCLGQDLMELDLMDAPDTDASKCIDFSLTSFV
jgi:hypothetical protein